MRRPFIAANWKMNKTLPDAMEFLNEFLRSIEKVGNRDIVIAPPFTALERVSERLKGTVVMLSAQDVFYEEKGAYTGEVSPLMLRDVGCRFVIIGHSERRQYFNETDETVNKKIKASLKEGLGVIFCIGESLSERNAGRTFDVLRSQVHGGLKGISEIKDIVIAYEPVWAIGTGVTATEEQAEEAHKYIRSEIKDMYGSVADKLRILYGGSVTPENINALMSCPDVDGALVGGASLKAESFAKIVKGG
ncbi:MAG: triose-phosphate isomerase [Nitrospirae bacterium]|nr:triose-phosphate isomerase [Nitrospirota bacterium]